MLTLSIGNDSHIICICISNEDATHIRSSLRKREIIIDVLDGNLHYITKDGIFKCSCMKEPHVSQIKKQVDTFQAIFR